MKRTIRRIESRCGTHFFLFDFEPVALQLSSWTLPLSALFLHRQTYIYTHIHTYSLNPPWKLGKKKETYQNDVFIRKLEKGGRKRAHQKKESHTIPNQVSVMI